MNTMQKAVEAKDRKVALSTLWIFLMFNYIYLDIAVMNFNPGVYQRIAAGLSEELVLGLSAVMEIAIAMPLLSRVLKYAVNRWANIIAGLVFTAFVALSVFGGNPPLYYLFIATIELATTVFIVWYAWTWPNPEGQR
ncbi:MAG TPA: DUF6326 family protein [Anaerolineales bacterium]